MHIDGARHGIGVISPDRTQELDARYCSSGTFHQVAEELEFAGGKVDRIAIARDLVAPDVDLNVAELVDALARSNRAPPQQDFTAGDEFRRFEGLCNVIIAPEAQANHLGGGLVAGTEKEDRSSQPRLANVPANIETAP